MLDMGFGVQLEAIAEYLPEVRQTLMFSATVPGNIMKLAGKYLKDPARVETHQPHVAAPKIRQELIHVNDDAKHDQLVKLLDERSGQIIVFVKTKHGADRLARKLARDEHSADAIHGDLRQGQRDRVLRSFRKNEVRILVATDVAARGLDIPLLETVINYDLPQCPEDYIHRIGRTGRNGAEGEAICLISGQDRSKWSAIDRLMNPGKKQERSERPSNGNGAKRRHEGGRNGSGFKKPDGKFGDKPSWKSSFKKDEGRKPFARDGGREEFRPRRSEERSDTRTPVRFESHDDPELAHAKSEFLVRKVGEKYPFANKPFG
jgi:superfamily II DNA/RNA helicase